MTERLPSVTVLLVNYNGEAHLPPCLDSIRELDYPEDAWETLVVDNGSTDGSLELLREKYPWARVLALDENTGFAEGNNVGAAASAAECLALVNTDMRVDPGWLRELVARYDPATGYRCVGGLILDWDGERLDFADGVMNYYGMAEQEGFGKPLADVRIPATRDLLFACAGSMLVEREAFLGVGGFDPEYFAYFEDVDLGWRLWLVGHRVCLAPRARVFHRHHGTGAGLPLHQRRILYEANALRTLLKNLGDANLWPILAAALLLLPERARTLMGTRREEYDLGTGATDETETVDRDGVAVVHAAADVAHAIDRVMRQRAEVQSLRKRDDAEIFELFRRPFMPLGVHGDGFVTAMANVTRSFGVAQRFPHRRATRVVVAGDDERARDLRREVARSVPVVELAEPDAALRAAYDADVLIARPELLTLHPRLAHVAPLTVLDLADKGTAASVPVELLEDVELVLAVSEAERAELLSRAPRRRRRGYAPRIVVVAGPDDVEPLVALCEEPWRWAALDVTEDAQRVAARRRDDGGEREAKGAPAPASRLLGVRRALAPRRRLRRLLRRR